jgi:hypothetical protein
VSNTHSEQHSRPLQQNRWQRASHWFTRHKRTVTVMSALSVLAGFIVQEALDEPVKDELSAIVVALQGQDHAQEGIGASTALQDIRADLHLVKAKLIDEKPLGDSERQLAQLQANRTDALVMVGGNIAALHSQVSALPADFRKKESDFETRYMALFVESGSDGNQNSIDALTRYEPRWRAIYDESRKLVGEGIHELQDRQEKAETRHHFYTGLSYISFFLGWSVGLLSNLATGKTGESAGG